MSGEVLLAAHQALWQFNRQSEFVLGVRIECRVVEEKLKRMICKINGRHGQKQREIN